MSENNKTDEFLQKLAPCIERGDLDACVAEAVRVAREMGVGAEELIDLSVKEGLDKKIYSLAYVLALVSEKGLTGQKKAVACTYVGVAAQLLEKLDKAKEYYNKAIELNPKNSEVHFFFAGLLLQQNQLTEAKEHYEEAIEYDRKNAMARALYSLVLYSYGKIEESRKEITLASSLIKEGNNFNFIKSFLYEKYSEINFNKKDYKKSSEDANIAGEEYLKAAETADGDLKSNLTLQGNILKAKSFVRKIPVKSWYKDIYYRFGKNPHISEQIDNLKNAALWYEKASVCPAGERKDVCNACFYSISVFSEILSAMKAFIEGGNADINKERWASSLESAHRIYTDKGLRKGAALVDTLKQLIKCVNELAEHRKIGLHIQEERLGKCYTNLMDVSEKLDGALGVIAEHSIEAIRDYAKKQGMGFIGGETKISLWGKLVEKIYDNVTTLIIAAVVYIFYLLNIIPKLTDQIKSLIGSP